jgi:hypothetical protein
MKVWGTVRREVAGAVRSVRYDVRQRVDATWSRTHPAYPEYDAYARRPRRVLIGSGITVLAAGGVAGTYLLLAGGLGGALLGSTNTPPPAGRPEHGSVTSAAHGPASSANSDPKLLPASQIPVASPTQAGEPKTAGSGQHPSVGTPSPSTSAHSGTPRPDPQPSRTPRPTPTDTTPQPTPTATPTPSPSTSIDPTTPAPEPSDSNPTEQWPDTPPSLLSDSRSTARPTGA